MALGRALAALLLALPVAAAGTGPEVVLLLVPPGASIADVQRARAAVGERGSVLIVGEGETIPVAEGVSIVADRTTASPLPAGAVAVLPGPLTEESVRFLSSERGLSRVILFAAPGPAVDRLRKAPGSALIAIGNVGALPALLARPAEEAVPRPAAAPPPAPPAAQPETPKASPEPAERPAPAPPESKPRSAAKSSPAKESAPAPKPAGGKSAFDTYFSTGASASERPKPAPPN